MKVQNGHIKKRVESEFHCRWGGKRFAALLCNVGMRRKLRNYTNNKLLDEFRPKLPYWSSSSYLILVSNQQWLSSAQLVGARMMRGQSKEDRFDFQVKKEENQIIITTDHLHLLLVFRGFSSLVSFFSNLYCIYIFLFFHHQDILRR